MSTDPPLNVVTGAYSLTGQAIARRLLARGERVRTLTNHPDRPHAFGDQVPAMPLSFDQPDLLRRNLEGASTLYNTYWVRFAHGSVTFDQAVARTDILLRAARAAGVRRVVQVTIANADRQSPLPYYRGKAAVEELVGASGMSYALLRPTVLFGGRDILINNIAWCLRRFPLFAIPGDGAYRLQPVHVEDVAELAVRAASGSGNEIIEATGPEAFPFLELVRRVAGAVGSRARIVKMPARMALLSAQLVGAITRDVLLTPDELDGLRTELLVCRGAPQGWTKLSEWLSTYGGTLGLQYASELKRHF